MISSSLRLSLFSLTFLFLSLIGWEVNASIFEDTSSTDELKSGQRRLLTKESSPLTTTTEATTSTGAGEPFSTKSFKPPVDIRSSWLGNRWFPDPEHYQLYNPTELKDVFANYNVLFIGDSTSRQDYNTLYALLNGTTTGTGSVDVTVHDIDDLKIVDVNSHRRRLQHEEPCQRSDTLVICREQPGDASKLFDYSWRNCPNRIDVSDWKHVFANYSLIVVSVGAGELTWSCDPAKVKKTGLAGVSIAQRENKALRMHRFENLVAGLQTVQRDDLMVVYRTMGNIGDGDDDPTRNRDSHAETLFINDKQRVLLDKHERQYMHETRRMSSLSYVDFGNIILPHRSYPEEKRIKGNQPQHYGWEARLAYLQMLTSHVVERERQKKEMQGAGDIHEG